MINTIIFDIGRVLVDFNWRSYLKGFQYDKEVEKAIADGMFLSETWQKFDRSQLSDEELLEEFISHTPQYEKEVREVFEHSGKTVTVYEQSKEWILELKNQGYKVYILSNYPRKTFEDTKSTQLTFLELIDGGIFSYEVKKIKPEREIYEALIEKYSINPKEAVFLDDNKANIEAGKTMGFHTILVANPKEAREELRKFLRKDEKDK